jgi:uncharacterized protein (DUF362 family)
MITPYLERLAAQAHAEGGWGYVPGQLAHLEPTCLALLALSLEVEAFWRAVRDGRMALDGSGASSDGSYYLRRGRDEAVWPTAQVLFVKAALDYPEAAVRRTAGRLLNVASRVPDDPEVDELVDIDCRLKGWPWAEGNFSWAEPTAWACLALRRAGFGGHPRVTEGLRLLLDRAADEGGINYGNRRVLGRMTAPLTEPTAFMLLALQGQADHPRMVAAVKYLARQAQNGEDLEQLCWIKLALDLYPELDGVAGLLPALDEKIRAAHQAREQVSWLRPSPVREALTALALAAGETNRFRLPAECRPHAPREAPHAEREAYTRPASWPVRLKTVLRGLMLEGAGRLRQPPARSEVHIARAVDYDADLAGIVREQYASFRARVPLAGKRVVLKPNLVEYHRDKVVNTNPRVVGAVIELCRQEGAADVVVAEGPGHCRNVEYLVSASGLGDVLKQHGVRFVDLNHDEPAKRLNLGRLTGLEYLYLARTIAEAEVVISLPKLKSHHWAGATLSLKNLFGTLPGICYGWPKNELHWRGIDNSIVDIALTRTPELAVVDGIIGMEGDGPLNGTPRPLGALIMGADLAAVDATCCRLMMLDPERIGYLTLAARKKLGRIHEAAIRQLGEPIAALAQPFELVPRLQGLCAGRPCAAGSES